MSKIQIPLFWNEESSMKAVRKRKLCFVLPSLVCVTESVLYSKCRVSFGYVRIIIRIHHETLLEKLPLSHEYRV